MESVSSVLLQLSTHPARQFVTHQQIQVLLATAQRAIEAEMYSTQLQEVTFRFNADGHHINMD